MGSTCLAITAATLLALCHATNEPEYTSSQDHNVHNHDDTLAGNYMDSNYVDGYYDYYTTFPSKPDCPCNYDETTLEAHCGYRRNIKTIPDCIPDTVQVLDLQGNWLEYNPRQFERFKDLRTLGLALNNFDRLGNDSFVGLSKLEELDLSNVFRHHTLSMSLYHLIDTSLSWNHITEIKHESFTGLSNLRRLDLRNNPIKLVDSSAFSILSNLNDLNISNPWITIAHQMHFVSQSFEGLSSLTYLGLENTDMFNTTSFPPDIFKPLTNLRHLNLHRFCRAPDGEEEHCPNLNEQIGSIPSLQYLYIDAERITQLGPSLKSLTNLREIEFLAVHDVHIKSLSNKIFENLENSPLRKISLKTDTTTHGKLIIDEVMPNTFAAFKSLEVLDFTFYSNSESSCFGEMQNIVSGLQNTMIKHLRISANHLMCDNDANELPDLRGTNLETLDLSHSMIVSVSGIDGVAREYGGFFYKLPESLRYLYLQHNKIQAVDLKYLRRLENLQVLNMSHQNQWTTIAPLRQKKSIRVSKVANSNTEPYEMLMDKPTSIGTDDENDYYNYKVDPEKCHSMPLSLETIDVSYSDLFNGFSQAFCDKNNSLKILDLSHQDYNIDTESLWKSMKSLLKLENLYLNGNGIKIIPADAFAKQTQLKTLSLAHNQLATVSFEVGTLVNLKRLDLQDNNIQYAEDRFVGEIEKITENQPTPNYEQFSLEKSPNIDFLARFNMHYYDHSTDSDGNRLTVDLSDNPLICDCDRINFVKWLRDTKLISRRGHDLLSCTYKNGSLVWLEDISEIYSILQRDCHENVKSLCISEDDNDKSHNSTSLVITGTVLGLVILGHWIVILILIRRQRKLVADRNGDDNIVLT